MTVGSTSPSTRSALALLAVVLLADRPVLLAVVLFRLHRRVQGLGEH